MSNLSKIRIKDANGVEKEHNIVDSRVGNLTELTTENKENLVNAINEVKGDIENKANKDLSNVTNEDFLNKCSVAGMPDASTKMDKDNPVGTGSLSIDRKSGTTIGKNSVALGKDCVAAGDYSLSMGYQNTVNAHHASAEGESNTIGSYGYRSHVEGWSNTVTGRNSHAEGYGNKASNSYTHAEGNQVIASGESAHAEGYKTTASGEAAHVEGRYSKAQKISTHAEGCFTIADSPDQHTEGRYNKIDSEGIYAHIVGNGSNDSNRSNAYTLDWDGNGVYSGKVSVGTDITPTEDNDLVTKKYVDDNSTIKAVDCTRAEYDAMEYHDPDTYYNIIDEDNGLATQETDGLMSKEDKIKLDGMSGVDGVTFGEATTLFEGTVAYDSTLIKYYITLTQSINNFDVIYIIVTPYVYENGESGHIYPSPIIYYPKVSGLPTSMYIGFAFYQGYQTMITQPTKINFNDTQILFDKTSSIGSSTITVYGFNIVSA